MKNREEVQDEIRNLKYKLYREEQNLKIIENAEKNNIDLHSLEGKYYKTKNNSEKNSSYYFVNIVNSYGRFDYIDSLVFNGEEISFSDTKDTLDYNYICGSITAIINDLEEITQEEWFNELKKVSKVLSSKIKDYEKKY